MYGISLFNCFLFSFPPPLAPRAATTRHDIRSQNETAEETASSWMPGGRFDGRGWKERERERERRMRCVLGVR